MSTVKQKTNLSVYGWIRQNALKEIPNEIIDLCILFYYNPFRFRRELNGGNLTFDEDDMKIVSTNSKGKTGCIFGEKVTNEMCDSLNIYYKITKNIGSVSLIFVGYFIASKFEENGFKYNTVLGKGENSKTSTAIACGSYNTFYLYRNDRFKSFGETTWFNSKRDNFMLCIDFKHDLLKIYHNNEFAAETSLEGVKEIFLQYHCIPKMMVSI